MARDVDFEVSLGRVFKQDAYGSGAYRGNVEGGLVPPTRAERPLWALLVPHEGAIYTAGIGESCSMGYGEKGV